MSDALIKAVDLVKYFETNNGIVHAVDHVNLEIPAGKTLGVVGESGCGKTTLGRCMINLIPATSGQVLLNGQDILDKKFNKKQLRKDVQIIFQDPYSSLDPRKTVADIIAEPLIANKICSSKAERKERVADIMETVGLAQRLANSYPHELDGGRRQRIGVARALVIDPKFVVCDEPVSALDVSIQAQILNLMMDIQEQRGIAYMFITHDMSVVKHISQEIMVMYLGQTVEKAPTEELFRNPIHPYTKSLLSAIPIPRIGANKGRILIKGEVSSPIEPGDECRFAKRCQYCAEACTGSCPALKEVSAGHFVACHLFPQA